MKKNQKERLDQLLHEMKHIVGIECSENINTVQILEKLDEVSDMVNKVHTNTIDFVL